MNTFSSTVIHDPILGKIVMSVEVVKTDKGQHVVLIDHRKSDNTGTMQCISVKNAIALNNLLTKLQLPKER